MAIYDLDVTLNWNEEVLPTTSRFDAAHRTCKIYWNNQLVDEIYVTNDAPYKRVWLNWQDTPITFFGVPGVYSNQDINNLDISAINIDNAASYAAILQAVNTQIPTAQLTAAAISLDAIQTNYASSMTELAKATGDTAYAQTVVTALPAPTNQYTIADAQAATNAVVVGPAPTTAQLNQNLNTVQLVAPTFNAEAMNQSILDNSAAMSLLAAAGSQALSQGISALTTVFTDTVYDYMAAIFNTPNATVLANEALATGTEAAYLATYETLAANAGITAYELEGINAVLVRFVANSGARALTNVLSGIAVAAAVYSGVTAAYDQIAAISDTTTMQNNSFNDQVVAAVTPAYNEIIQADDAARRALENYNNVYSNAMQGGIDAADASALAAASNAIAASLERLNAAEAALAGTGIESFVSQAVNDTVFSEMTADDFRGQAALLNTQVDEYNTALATYEQRVQQFNDAAAMLNAAQQEVSRNELLAQQRMVAMSDAERAQEVLAIAQQNKAVQEAALSTAIAAASTEMAAELEAYQRQLAEQYAQQLAQINAASANLINMRNTLGTQTDAALSYAPTSTLSDYTAYNAYNQMQDLNSLQQAYFYSQAAAQQQTALQQAWLNNAAGLDVNYNTFEEAYQTVLLSQGQQAADVFTSAYVVQQVEEGLTNALYLADRQTGVVATAQGIHNVNLENLQSASDAYEGALQINNAGVLAQAQNNLAYAQAMANQSALNLYGEQNALREMQETANTLAGALIGPSDNSLLPSNIGGYYQAQQAAQTGYTQYMSQSFENAMNFALNLANTLGNSALATVSAQLEASQQAFKNYLDTTTATQLAQNQANMNYQASMANLNANMANLNSVQSDYEYVRALADQMTQASLLFAEMQRAQLNALLYG